MSDTRNEVILSCLEGSEPVSRPEIERYLRRYGLLRASITLIRDLNTLINAGLVERRGHGRACRYLIRSTRGQAQALAALEYGNGAPSSFSLAFFDEARQVLSAGEKLEAERLGRLYRRMRSQATPEQRRLHDRRLVVEFAWKNSRLNGCGYSLLETDRLLNDGVTAEGRSLAEARVLVNHQKVMERVMEENERYAVLTAEKLTELHGLLMAGLLVDPAVEGGLRQDSVTVIGGDRVPAVGSVCPVPRLLDHLLAELSRNDCPAERALALALTMGVLRPFRRGNDFMARLAATIALLAGGSCPLSGRSLNLQAHVSAVHMLRGTQDVLALKYQFLEQYRKAVNTGF